jgi:hypothetical protein
VGSARDKQARCAPALAVEQVPAPVRAPLSLGAESQKLAAVVVALLCAPKKAATSEPPG